MCADIVERFQLALMLSVIALRNMIEMAGSEIAFLPKSFIRGKSLVDSILSVRLACYVRSSTMDLISKSDADILAGLVCDHIRDDCRLAETRIYN